MICMLFIVSSQVSCAIADSHDPPNNTERPNIIVVLADDMGYSDLACYGSEIETPNLDALAANGLRFTQFYNTSRCCPSRASLLTGLYPHRAEMGWMTAANMGRPGYLNQLTDKAVTIPEALSEAGYATAMIGKWHVTYTDSFKNGPNGSWPTERGFDQFYGTLSGAKDYFKPEWLVDGTEHIKDVPEGYYYTRAISSRAADFIRETPEDQPLFIYLAFYAPHFPLHAPQETVNKYKGRYELGWDHYRSERFERQLEFGVIPPDTRLPDRDPDVPAWDDLSDEKRADMIDRMTIYAAQVDELDQGIGRVVKSLKETGRYDNTLLIFVSDNGAVGLSVWGRGKHSQLNKSGPFTDYGRGWSNVSNTPYRYYKRHSHEGGVMTPMIVHWPNKIADGGSLRHDPGHIMDILPTCLDVAGVEHPQTTPQGRPALQPDGISLMPAIDGRGLDENRPLCFEHEGHHGVRMGPWKLVALSGKPWELYNLKNDRSEMHNLADKDPAKVKELAAVWTDWAERSNVLPLDDTGWSKRIKDARNAGR